MSKIHFFEDATSAFEPAKAEAGQEHLGSPGSSRMRHPGGENEPQLFEIVARPNLQVDVHAHQEDEIIYVISGELRLGARALQPGDSVMIPGMTLYGFKSGPEGARFLNFRGRRDCTFYSREELNEFHKLDEEGRRDMTAKVIRRTLDRVGWVD
jgi:quercetin dioxygenase-like cupin family protein